MTSLWHFSLALGCAVLASAPLGAAGHGQGYGFGRGARGVSRLDSAQVAQVEAVLRHVLGHTSDPHRLIGLLHDTVGDNRTQCLVDLHRWGESLDGNETWALQMADSTSKFITGILYGQDGDLGDFDECVESSPGNLGTGDDFSGFYALPTITIETESNNNWTKEVSLSFALCVPSTCNASTVEAGLLNLLQYSFNNISELFGLRILLTLEEERTSVYGLYRKPDGVDWLVAAVIFFLLLVVIICTFADLYLGPERLKSSPGLGTMLVQSFSARLNLDRMLVVTKPGGQIITCIDGIRVFSMLWIVLAHRFTRGVQTAPNTDLILVEDYLYGNYTFTILILDATLAVDTFLLVGGIVNTYVFMKGVKKTNKFDVPRFYIHRYVRLTPLFMLIVGVSATWISVLGNGPLWYSVYDTSTDCRMNWWYNLLYVANYADPRYPCQVLWYPNVDMQLYWVSPLLLVPLWKWPRLGLYWLYFVILLAAGVPLILSLENNWRFYTPVGANLEADYLWRSMYLSTHMRATPYMVGLLTGYILYLHKIEKRPLGLNRLHKWGLWILSTAAAAFTMILACPLWDTEYVKYNKLFSGFYIAFGRLFWSFSISWIVVACVSGNAPLLDRFLSWGPLTVISRFTFGIYVTHNLAQVMEIGLFRSADFYNAYILVHRTLGDFILAIFIAAFLQILIEYPAALLERALWDYKPVKKNPEEKRATA